MGLKRKPLARLVETRARVLTFKATEMGMGRSVHSSIHSFSKYVWSTGSLAMGNPQVMPQGEAEQTLGLPSWHLQSLPPVPGPKNPKMHRLKAGSVHCWLLLGPNRTPWQ